MVNDKKWESLFGFPKREGEGELQQHEADLALAIQKVTEEIVVKMAAHAKELTGAKAICMAGGVALNCVANGKLQNEGIFDEVYIQPQQAMPGERLGLLWRLYIFISGKTEKRNHPTLCKVLISVRSFTL